MATNDEIREQDDKMAYYNSLTPEAERSLNKARAEARADERSRARADERSRVLEECEYRLHKEIMRAFMQAMADIDQAIFRQIHELKNNENEGENGED
jgi:hypothetical protein